MKLLFVIMLFLGFYATAASENNRVLDTEKHEMLEREKGKTKKESSSKNFHSVKRWKMTIEHTNGDIISKIITVKKNSNLSAMQTAFMEAEKHLEKLRNVKTYSVSPVSSNSYVLLADH
ncbi:hypothetical protein ACFSTE_18265 [Aquimarina hainanensis]|uniref:Uncharacterized protein n=1 Tax=Aquimarina hainanensis TaxID=1578017 RepID=A0ABW5NDY9_9FLAO